MTVNLSIKNVPEELTVKVKARAARNHRSLQGELMSILEESVKGDSKLTPEEVLSRVRTIGLTTSSKSATFVREDRETRSRR